MGGVNAGIAAVRRSGFRLFWKKHGISYLFLAPFLAFFLLFTVLPVLASFALSMTNFNMLQSPKWMGLTNYALLFLEDDIFLTALKNTFVFALVIGPVGYCLSFMAAWVLNQLKFRSGFALAFYAPSITSGIAMSVVWLYFFSNDRYGLINNFLINLGAIAEPILWTLNVQLIMPVVIVISLWMSMGNGFLVFLAGLQNVPREIYEAGQIDGVMNKFQELWYITLPMVKPQLLFGAVMSIVASFTTFDIATSVAGFPSPQYAAHTVVAHMYDYSFVRFQMGYSTAVAVVLFLITFLLGRLVMRLLSSKGE